MTRRTVFLTLSGILISGFLFLFIQGMRGGSLLSMPGVKPAEILVTIKPLHSLVTQITRNICEPKLLLESRQSPHTCHLTPQQIFQMKSCKIFVWTGARYETFLQLQVERLEADKATVNPRTGDAMGQRCIAMAQTPDLIRYHNRFGGCGHAHEASAHSDTHHNQESCHEDGHYWLDPQNAIRFCRYLSKALEEAYPQRRETIRANLRQTIEGLEALEKRIAQTVAPVRGRTFWIYHDFLQYFDKRFGTCAADMLSTDVRHPVRARTWLKQAQGIACIFVEPQFETGLGEKLKRVWNVPVCTLDYLGIDIAAGNDAYEKIMMRLAQDLAQGLK